MVLEIWSFNLIKEKVESNLYRLLLAAWAEVGRAAGNADLFDRCAAGQTGSAGAAVYFEIVLGFTAAAGNGAVVAQRGAAAADGALERE
jgi:hypothetical protein